jgi:hypothetical protein
VELQNMIVLAVIFDGKDGPKALRAENARVS